MQETNNEKVRTVAPPYIPYRTFINILERFKANGIPARIDRSVLPNLSGAYQAQVLNALKYLGLIGEHGTTKDVFNKLIESEGEEKVKILREIINIAYLFLCENNFIKSATTNQIEDKFKEIGVSGDTLRKCIMFFLRIAKDAQIEVSPYIKPYQNLRRRSVEQKPRPINDENQLIDEGEEISRSLKETPKTWTELLLSKFPEFNPEWSDEIQKKWFEAFDKLMKAGERKEED